MPPDYSTAQLLLIEIPFIAFTAYLLRQYLLHRFCDRIILAVCEEILCKMFAAQSAFYQFSIELSEDGDHIVVRYFLDFIEDFLISLFRYDSFFRITAAAGCTE